VAVATAGWFLDRLAKDKDHLKEAFKRAGFDGKNDDSSLQLGCAEDLLCQFCRGVPRDTPVILMPQSRYVTMRSDLRTSQVKQEERLTDAPQHHETSRGRFTLEFTHDGSSPPLELRLGDYPPLDYFALPEDREKRRLVFVQRAREREYRTEEKVSLYSESKYTLGLAGPEDHATLGGTGYHPVTRDLHVRDEQGFTTEIRMSMLSAFRVHPDGNLFNGLADQLNIGLVQGGGKLVDHTTLCRDFNQLVEYYEPLASVLPEVREDKA
jgi:hypothetical protein